MLRPHQAGINDGETCGPRWICCSSILYVLCYVLVRNRGLLDGHTRVVECLTVEVDDWRACHHRHLLIFKLSWVVGGDLIDAPLVSLCAKRGCSLPLLVNELSRLDFTIVHQLGSC